MARAQACCLSLSREKNPATGTGGLDELRNLLPDLSVDNRVVVVGGVDSWWVVVCDKKANLAWVFPAN